MKYFKINHAVPQKNLYMTIFLKCRISQIGKKTLKRHLLISSKWFDQIALFKASMIEYGDESER